MQIAYAYDSPLQGARTSRIAEATGRATMFLGAVSGGLVALGLIATGDRPGTGLPGVIEEFAPQARHVFEQCPNNIVEADHRRLKARLRPMRGLKTSRSLHTVAAGTRSCRICAAATMNSPRTG